VTALLRAVTGFLLVKLGVLLFNMARFPILRSAAWPPGSVAAAGRPASDSVSLLVPMRDEAARLRSSIGGLLRQEVRELIILDDESGDGSGSLARSLVAAHPRARVVTGAAAPPGWVGKNWACHQLAAQATGSLLVFCDADVMLADGAVDAVIREMRAQRADVFSVFPRQITASLGEHLVTPLIDDVLLCFLPFGLLSAPVPSAATANGSIMVFTWAAFRRLGGFAAVRTEIVEDVAIARRTRRAGLKLGLTLGGAMVATRMYDGYSQVVTGLARGLLPMAGGSRGLLVLAAGWHLAAYTLPWGMTARRRAWAIPLALGVAERALVEIKTGRRTVWQAVLMPMSPLAAAPVIARALLGQQRWKGRALP